MGRGGGGAGRAGGGGGGAPTAKADQRTIAQFNAAVSKQKDAESRLKANGVNLESALRRKEYVESLSPVQQRLFGQYQKAARTSAKVARTYRDAELRQSLRTHGRVMDSKYPGVSAISGAKFPAGTRIYYGQSRTYGGGRVAVPASEIRG